MTLPGPIQVADDGDNTLTIVNTYSPEESVTLVKDVFGPLGAEFTITLACQGFDPVSATVSHGGSVSIGNVPVGTSCTGSEADPGPDWDGSGETSLTVQDDGPNTLYILNTYSPEEDVTLTKWVKGRPRRRAVRDHADVCRLRSCGPLPSATAAR